MERLSEFLKHSKKTVLLIVGVAAITIVVSSLIAMWLDRTTDFQIPSLGTIRFEGVEGYWDSNLTNKTGTDAPCNWGSIWPGATKNVTLYLRSISNVETKLNHTETNWTFYNSNDKVVAGPSSNTTYMHLAWNYDSSTVHPGQTVQVILSLHASSSSDFVQFLMDNDVKAFSVDIYISAYKHG